MKHGTKAKLVDGNLVISGANKVKSKLQTLALQRLVEAGELRRALDYMQTFNGTFNSMRSVKSEFRSFGFDPLTIKGRNSVLSYFDSLIDPRGEHVPRNSEKIMKSTASDWIGVEIECFIPYSSVDVDHEPSYCECSECFGSGEVYNIAHEDDGESPEYVECSCCDGSGQVETDGDDDNSDNDQNQSRRALASLIKARKIRTVSVVDDGSIDQDAGHFPVEIRVLTRLSNTKNLHQVCLLLSELKAKVNKSCGLHIHFDQRGSSTERVSEIGHKLKRALPVLAAMVPKSRRENQQYCQLGVSGLKGSRYYAVNLTSFAKHQTIEVRLHSATTDFNKIMNWATLIDSIIKAEYIGPNIQSLNDLTEYIKIDENLVEYITQRTALFNRGTDVNPTVQDHDSTETQLEIGA